MPPTSESLAILDARQLARIEATHRGFLYQHLYAAGCLLLAASAGAVSVLVERDEDVEIKLPDRCVYVQVKTRTRPLTQNDVKGALSRFKTLRATHASGARPGKASFWILSNTACGPALLAEIRSGYWPVDVTVRWPGHNGQLDAALPPAWVDAAEAVAWCAALAASLPLAALVPETLVWKLAGLVTLASSGTAPYENHAFHAEALPDVFEQVVLQLHEFPTVPTCYRPQAGEPNLITNQRVRVISGFSGAGKTAWASQAALHCALPAAYFDAGDVPGTALATALGRELLARLLGASKGGLGQVLLPGATGTELLRVLDRRLQRDGIDAVVFVDNAHQVPGDALRSVIQATSRLRFVLLCQPGQTVVDLTATLGIPEERLSGWTVDTIAEEVAASGGRADYATCQRLRETTGGLPLYVQSALQAASTVYGGDVAALCTDIRAQTHVVQTAQEAILARMYDALSPAAKAAVALLSVAECPLTRDELASLAQALLGVQDAALFPAIRSLAATGIIQVVGRDRLQVHDAVRMLGRARLGQYGGVTLGAAQATLKGILSSSLQQQPDIARFPAFVRLLGATGDVDTLVDLAGHELFHEFGVADDILSVLEGAAGNANLPASQRFWALDALVFAELTQSASTTVSEHLALMTRLLCDGGLGKKEQLALCMKRMLAAAHHGRAADVQAALEELATLTPDEPTFLRVAKHNAACSFYFLGNYQHAMELAEALIREYYDHLGIHPGDVLARNPKDIWPLLRDTERVQDDLKHLADELDLYARCCSELRVESRLARIHAFKFYTMANALESAIKVGQDAVDDPIGARQLLEDLLLPVVYSADLADRVIPVRSQYAVVLAYCGDFAGADAEMLRLTPYESGLTDDGRKELRIQRRLVDRLREAHVEKRLIASTDRKGAQKVGRNEPCPCGSGRKYKKCHGAGSR
jgi:hypothetical protein